MALKLQPTIVIGYFKSDFGHCQISHFYHDSLAAQMRCYGPKNYRTEYCNAFWARRGWKLQEVEKSRCWPFTRLLVINRAHRPFPYRQKSSRNNTL